MTLKKKLGCLKVGLWTIILRDNYHVVTIMETTLTATHDSKIFFDMSECVERDNFSRMHRFMRCITSEIGFFYIR